MIYPYNAHTHTIFCDGSDTAENMVRAAIARGFKTAGFSGHSPLPFEADWCMTPEGEQEYIKTVEALKAKYAGQIDILTGIEMKPALRAAAV